MPAFLDSVASSICLSWYRWALREINPAHPDTPGIVLRIAELEIA